MQRVVILYTHPLLGEGLQRLLGSAPGLDVQLVQVDGAEVVEQALRLAPDVVIVERTPILQAIDLLRLAPSALVVDVGLDAGPSWTYHRDQISPQPEELLRTIAAHGHPVTPAA